MRKAMPPRSGQSNGQGNNVSICHETGSETNPIVEIDVNENAVNGHGPGGNNGQGGHNDDECYQEPVDNEEPNVPPVVAPPVDAPPVVAPPLAGPPVVAPPVVAPPVAAPPAVVPKAPPAPAVKPVVKPAAKTLAKPAAAAPVAAAPAVVAPVAAMSALAPATNAGYNVQTAAGGDAGIGIPSWLATLTGALAGLSGLVLLRGGMRARKLGG